MEPVNPDSVGADQLYPGEEPLPQPTVSDRETLIRRAGALCGLIGAALIGAALIVAGWYATVVDHTTWASGDTSYGAVIFWVAMLAVTLTIGGGLLTLSGLEVLTRYGRTMSRRTLHLLRASEELHAAAAAHIAENNGMIRRLGERLAEVEKTIADLPGYGQGVIDGVQIRQSAGVPDNGD